MVILVEDMNQHRDSNIRLHMLVTTIIGASLSEPHIDEFAVNFLYICCTLYPKSLPALILRVFLALIQK